MSNETIDLNVSDETIKKCLKYYKELQDLPDMEEKELFKLFDEKAKELGMKPIVFGITMACISGMLEENMTNDQLLEELDKVVTIIDDTNDE